MSGFSSTCTSTIFLSASQSDQNIQDVLSSLFLQDNSSKPVLTPKTTRVCLKSTKTIKRPKKTNRRSLMDGRVAVQYLLLVKKKA